MARQIDGIRRMLLIINKIYATNGQYGMQPMVSMGTAVFPYMNY